MCQEHNGTRIYTKADHGNSRYWSEEQALRGASRGALRAGSEGPRSLPGSRCDTTLQLQRHRLAPHHQHFFRQVTSLHKVAFAVAITLTGAILGAFMQDQ